MSNLIYIVKSNAKNNNSKNIEKKVLKILNERINHNLSLDISTNEKFKLIVKEINNFNIFGMQEVVNKIKNNIANSLFGNIEKEIINIGSGVMQISDNESHYSEELALRKLDVVMSDEYHYLEALKNAISKTSKEDGTVFEIETDFGLVKVNSKDLNNKRKIKELEEVNEVKFKFI